MLAPLSAYAIDDVEYEVATAAVSANAAFQNVLAAGSVAYKVSFELASGSDGINPLTETMELEIEPNPAHSPTEIEQPCWLVFIPPGCFQAVNNRYELVDPFECGMKLFVETETTQTEITEYVTGMEGSVRIRNDKGVAKLEFETEQINPVAIVDPCWLSFRIGDDGMIRVPLDSTLEFSGSTNGSIIVE